MIADASKKQFQRVIVWKLDRFARNRYDSATYKHKLKQYGVKVVSAMENIGDNPESILLEALLEASAEYYSLDLKTKIKRGLRDSAAKGQYVGGNLAYGYSIEDKRFLINEQQADVVRYVFTEFANGTSPKKIIAYLRERGVRTNRGTTIGHNYVIDMVQNRKYIGEYKYDGNIIEGGCPAIVDIATFEKAQSRVKINKRLRRGVDTKEAYLLHGKAYCGMCGALLTSESGYGRNGEKYCYYTCSTRKRNHMCSKKNENKDQLEQFVVEQTLDYILIPERIEYISNRLVEEYDKEFTVDKIKELEKRVKTLEAKIERNIELTLNAPNDKMRTYYTDMSERLDAELSELQIEIAKLKVASKVRYTSEEIANWLKTFCTGDPLDREFMQRIIDVFINSVYVYDDRVVIYYNVMDGTDTLHSDPIKAKAEPSDEGSTHALCGGDSRIRTDGLLNAIQAL
jgi:site-specific DNA recombinase